MSLHIRRATHSDLTSITRISAEAFRSNPVDTAMHPRLAQYPADFRRSEDLHVRTLFHAAGGHTFVACLAPVEGEGVTTLGSSPEELPVEEVVGVAMWVRRGRGAVARKWRSRSWFSIIQYYYYTTLQALFSALDRSRSLQMSQRRQTAALSAHRIPNIIDFDAPDAEYWWLGLLAVAPKAQGQKLGQQLVQWGLARAGDEGLLVGVWAARGLVGFYEQMGFKVLRVIFRGEEGEECLLVRMPVGA